MTRLPAFRVFEVNARATSTPPLLRLAGAVLATIIAVVLLILVVVIAVPIVLVGWMAWRVNRLIRSKPSTYIPSRIETAPQNEDEELRENVKVRS